jgi:hypothetical protein
MRCINQLISFAVSTALAFYALNAHAQATDKAAAEALFKEGRQLIQDGKYEQACQKLEASQQLDAGVGTLLYLGECYSRSGRTASAWATFLEAASLAKSQGQADREKIARQRAAAMEPQLSKIVVVADRVQGMEILHNGRAVPQASWGVPIPVDPGPQTIEARAPGRNAWSTTITVNQGPGSTNITIPTLETAPETAAPNEPPTPAVAEEPTAPAPSRPAPEAKGSAQRTVGFIAGGVGLVGMAVGSVFGVLAIDKNAESLDECRTDTLCSERGLTLRSEAQDSATYSTIAFVAGGALLTTGVILVLSAPSAGETAGTQVAISTTATPSSLGLSLGGRW